MGCYTLSETFSITHARHIASRIAGDLRLMSRYYGYPSLSSIDEYLEEIAQLLAKGYLASFEIGYKTAHGRRIYTFFYEVQTDGTLSDDRSGGFRPGIDVSAGRPFNYLIHSRKWWTIPEAERDAFDNSLPIQRTGQPEPTDGYGYWQEDRTYSAGGASVRRRRFVPL